VNCLLNTSRFVLNRLRLSNWSQRVSYTHYHHIFSDDNTLFTFNYIMRTNELLRHLTGVWDIPFKNKCIIINSRKKEIHLSVTLFIESKWMHSPSSPLTHIPSKNCCIPTKIIIIFQNKEITLYNSSHKYIFKWLHIIISFRHNNYNVITNVVYLFFSLAIMMFCNLYNII